MARPRSKNRDKAFQIWQESGGTKLLKDIATELGVSDSQVRKWKNLDKWEDKAKGTLPNSKGNVTKKRGAPKGNKNAVGYGAPAGNKNAETHGFFSKYLPEETYAIMREIQEKDPLDLLWENIVIQYTAIIRAQRIMFVRDQQDKTIERIEEKHGNVWGEKWGVQQAWDKHATFLKAQSRAMSELRSMIKQYDELLKSGLATEEQKLRIEKLRADVNALRGEGSGDSREAIENFIQATTMKQDEVKALFEGEDDENIQE